MARLTYNLGRGLDHGEGQHPEIVLDNRLVNLHRDENVSEEYLLNINAKGQVRDYWIASAISSILCVF